MFGKVGQEMPLAKANDQRRPVDPAPLLFLRANQTRKGWQQRQRHVVDAKIPEVLERVGR